MRNKFSTAYGLLVITTDFRVVLIERIVPYCVQNYFVKKFTGNSFIKPPPGPLELQDYNRYLNHDMFEDQWDIPHGQLPKKKNKLSSAYREFREETGFLLEKKKHDIKAIAQISFVGRDQFEYTQYYFIIVGAKVEMNEKKKNLVDRLTFKGHLLTFEDAYSKLLAQQTLKQDNKHLLIQRAFMMSVRFDPQPPIIHSYNSMVEEEGIDYCQIARDREREEPPMLLKTSYIQCIKKIFQMDYVVVFGNLGRCPHLLKYYLDVCFLPDCNIRVDDGGLYNDDKDFVSCYRDDGESECDILIVAEPDFGQWVQKSTRARQIVYLSSHLNLYIPSSFQLVAYHFGEELKKLPPLSDDNDTIVMVPHLGKKDYLPADVKKIRVDLTKCRTAKEAYLNLLHARDRMSEQCDTLEGYSVRMNKHHEAAIRTYLKCCPKNTLTPGNVGDIPKMLDWYSI